MIGQDIQFFKCFRESLQVLMLTVLNSCGKSLYKLYRLFLLIRSIWAVPPRRAGKTSLMLFLIVDSRSLSSVIWEELTIFTKDQHLHCILLKKLGNLKFVSKGEKDEVFGMPIPNELISNNIRNALYYSAYLEMVTKHDQKIAAEQSGKKKPATAKQPKPKPASKPAPAPEPKAGKGKVAKVHNVKSSFQLVEEPDEEPAQPKHEPEAEHHGNEPVAEATRPLPVVKGKGKAIVTAEQVAQSLLALHTPKRRSDRSQYSIYKMLGKSKLFTLDQGKKSRPT
ncbi:hypothetical protein Tco_0331085 [Tanacetum coccineum]